MKIEDIAQYAFGAIEASRTRTALILLAMTIAVASVVVLTALGEGARQYVTGQFSSLGTNLLIVLPGRSETTGGPPPMLGETPRDLTLDDALAIERSDSVRRVAPVSVGSAPVSWKARERELTVLGSTAELRQIRHLSLGQGKFLPTTDPRRSLAVCVLGYKAKSELFGNEPALGKWIRIGDRRYRVIGVLAKKGQSLGVHIGDSVVIPVASAQSLFNTASLFRILVQAKNRESIPKAEQAIISILRERHEGEEDVTVITQDAVLGTFDKILTALTYTVAGIAGISLVVAGILIMNVMLVAVTQRTGEIGLLKAVGAPRSRVLGIFLMESAMLSLIGCTFGLIVGYLGAWVLGRLFPNFPIVIPLWTVAAAVGVSLCTGLIFGVWPAKRAARLDPVKALSHR